MRFAGHGRETKYGKESKIPLAASPGIDDDDVERMAELRAGPLPYDGQHGDLMNRGTASATTATSDNSTVS